MLLGWHLLIIVTEFPRFPRKKAKTICDLARPELGPFMIARRNAGELTVTLRLPKQKQQILKKTRRLCHVVPLAEVLCQ